VTPSIIPSELHQHRVLNAKQAAALFGMSVVQWRRMYRDGRAPAPIRLSERKYGWRASVLTAWLEAQQSRAA
jgi:predicted DNA-binding transcriptional regulator AlpA